MTPGRSVVVAIAAMFVLLHGGPALGQNARKIFDEGAKAYSEQRYATAAEKFEQAYSLKPNTRTLFAWAQAERFGGNCSKAIELLDKLESKKKLSKANREAIKENKLECQRLLAEARRLAAETQRAAQPVAEPTPEPVAAELETSVDDTATRGWYADPVGGVLVSTGVVGIGLAIGLALSASSANDEAEQAVLHSEYLAARERARSRSRLAFIAAGAGAALLTTGLIRYVLVKGTNGRESGLAVVVSRDSAGLSWSAIF